MDKLNGQIVRGYELRQKIGTGGFGNVYLAYQEVVGREVAIKVILPEFANQPDFIRRFEAEAQLIARLEHPFIVPLHDYWRDPSGAYLVMRYLRGGSLREKLDLGPLSVEDTLKMLEQIGSALAVAHRSGVIHRDLKPDNILLDEEGNSYLADFGIAKNLENPDTVESAKALVGSPAYLPPEQIKAGVITAQADIYSFGMMLFEALTGERPFSDAQAFPTLIAKHLNELLPPLYTINPALTDELDVVIQKATAKEASKRYPDVMSLIQDFRVAAGLAHRASSGERAIDLTKSIEDDSGIYLENPYKGLRAFQEVDSVDFYGRAALIELLIKRLLEPGPMRRILVVIGPSGSGKSSVVKAGLLPAIRRGALPSSEQWFVTEMTPGSDPFVHLADALLGVAIGIPKNLQAELRATEHGLVAAVEDILPPDEPTTELLLIIDQFEELFTLVEEESVRVHFLESLREAVMDPNSRLRLIVTLRADFVDRPLQYVGFGDLVRRRNEFVLPLAPDELRQTIVGPAEGVGATLQEELVGAILKDVGDQPGALPLLEYALTELFEHRKGRKLTLEAYQSSGGVMGAVARRAEELYVGLDKAGQAAARQVFLRLVTLGEGVEDTRRRVRRTEFASMNRDTATMDNVIDTYAKYRLLTLDRDPITRGPTVEVAHEALIRTWSRLRDWLNESREELRIERRLTSGAAEWITGNHEPSFLASGTRLDQFEHFEQTTSLTLGADETAYLKASIARRAEENAQEEIRKAHEAATARLARNFQRITIVLGAVGVLAVLALIASAFQVSSARSDVAAAQVQVAAVGQTLTPAQIKVDQANAILVTAQNQIVLVQQTLTPAQVKLDLANTIVSTAQTQIMVVQQTLTPAQRRLDQANGLVSTAQTQIAVVAQTLTPAQSKLDQANALVSTAQTQVVAIGQTLTPIPLTLTPVSSTLQAANLQVTNAGVIAGQTLTPISQTLVAVATTARNQQNNLEAFRFASDADAILGENGDPTLAILLSIRGLKTVYSPQADAVLGRALTDADKPRIITTSSTIYGVAFTPDGKGIFTANFDNKATLWNILTGQPIMTFNGHTGKVNSIAASPDGKLMITGSADFTAKIWDVTTGQVVFSLPVGAVVNGVAFSPDSKLVATADDQRNVKIWEVTGGTLARTLSGHTSPVTSVAFSPDGTQIVSGSADNTARLWDAGTGDPVRTFKGHANAVKSVAFSPDGKQVATGSLDTTIRIWSVSQDQPLQTLEGKSGFVESVAFSPDGQHLLTGFGNKTARLWDVATGSVLRILTSQTNDITGVAFSPDGQHFVTASSDATVRYWNADITQDRRLLKGQVGAVTSVAFSPDGKQIVTGSLDTTAQLWDSATGQPAFTLNDNSGSVNGVAFSPDSKQVITATANGTAQLWSTVTGKTSTIFRGHTAVVTSVVFSPDGAFALTGSADKTARLWNVATGDSIMTFNGHTQSVRAVAFSPDGKSVLTSSDDSTAILWDVATGNQIKTFSGHASSVRGVAFSPDGKTVLTGSADKTARLWDVATGNLLKTFVGHTGPVLSVAFSPDGKQVLTGSADNTARLWDVSSGDLLRTISVHTQAVNGVAFSPDGKELLTGSTDQTAQITDANYHDFVTYACTRVSRDFTSDERSQFGITDTAPTCARSQ